MSKILKWILDFFKRYHKIFEGLILLFIVLVFFYKCPIKIITGIPCPGCGMTRACIMAFYDIKSAFYMHPLFPCCFIFAGGIFVKKIRENISYTHFTYIAIFLLLAVYIWRMLMFFPSVEPMEYNEKNLLGFIIGMIT